MAIPAGDRRQGWRGVLPDAPSGLVPMRRPGPWAHAHDYRPPALRAGAGPRAAAGTIPSLAAAPLGVVVLSPRRSRRRPLGTGRLPSDSAPSGRSRGACHDRPSGAGEEAPRANAHGSRSVGVDREYQAQRSTSPRKGGAAEEARGDAGDSQDSSSETPIPCIPATLLWQHVCARKLDPSPRTKSRKSEIFFPRPAQDLWPVGSLWQHVCARKSCRAP